MQYVTFSPEDDKIRLYVGRVPREDYDRLRAAGFVSTPKQDCDLVATWTPTREDLAREFLDDDQDIEDEDYSPEERAADRAERFGGYRDKRRAEAGGSADTFDAGPSAFGHQNIHKAERQAARHDRHRTYAVSQWSKAEYWQERTAGVIANALYKSSAHVRRGRILTLESDLRKAKSWGDGYDRWITHYELRLTYERAMLAVDGGTVTETDIEPGGWLRPARRDSRFGRARLNADGFCQVLKVFKSPATGRVTSVQVMGADPFMNDHEVKPRTINVERLGEDAYRAPTDAEREQFATVTTARKAAKKAAKPVAPSLINPTEEDAQKLQDFLNSDMKAKHERSKSYGDCPVSTVKRMTQAEYSAESGGTYSRCETSSVTENRRLQEIHSGDRVTCFKVRTASPGGFCYAARRVIVITDKPQKPLPWANCDSALATMPTLEKLLPRLQDIGNAVARSWQCDDDQKALLSDADYVGLVHAKHICNASWSEKGAALYREFLDAQKATPVGELQPA